MCGIAGILSMRGHADAGHLHRIASTMSEGLAHRGPDDQGVWVDPIHAIALSHRRLSIIDLSPEGHQPMVSACGRYVISFNGEIYNYRTLRDQLSCDWRGQSDTEVLLAAIAAWGIEKTLTMCNGMFAFAIWDRHTQTLTLARDRMGEKPLYYGWVGEYFVFASELKAFRTIPGWPPTINREALFLLIRQSYIPAPHSIYERIFKLKPASFLCIRPGQPEVTQTPYWSLEELVQQTRKERFSYSHAQAIDALDTQLGAAVGQRMMADVPLGVFLSGGVDSSIVTALMQAQASRPVKTFSIGFSESGFDEAPYAKAVANHLGTEHTEMYVSSAEAAATIPLLPTIYDEPFADSSQIPTYLVSRFAREHVTVALSGDGGDELFGGYPRYLRGPALWRGLARIPLPARKLAARALLRAHHALGHRLAPDSSSRRRALTRKLANYYEKIGTSSALAFYRQLGYLHNHPEEIVVGGRAPLEPLSACPPGIDHAEWMMLLDALHYFPGDILTKVDRASMAVGLETRTPFTDPDLIRFVWQLPAAMRIQNGQGKWLLRQLLYRYVPQPLIERPKAGFSAPIGAWLRGPLASWAEDLIAPETLHRQGFLDPSAVHAMWRAHQSGTQDHEHRLWNILMFQSWLASNA